MFDTLKTQRALASIYAPSGYETELTHYITEQVKPYADDCRVDALGNLIVHKKGAGKRIMMSAHMDSIGLVVTHIDENGFLRFCNVGGISLPRLISCPVVFGNGVRGVVNVEEKTKLADLKLFNGYIDIGATTREAAGKMVSIGDIAVFKADTYLMGERLVSPYLDDRIGCVVLLQVLSMVREPVNDLYFVFSVQEEVGACGAKTAAYGVHPELGIVVDITASGDIPEQKAVLPMVLGKGAAIKIRDNSLMSHPKVIKLLESVSADAKIPTQREILPFGGTDGGPIHLSHEGVPTGGVSIPTRYAHDPAEVAQLSDIEACTRLLLAIANTKIEL